MTDRQPGWDAAAALKAVCEKHGLPWRLEPQHYREGFVRVPRPAWVEFEDAVRAYCRTQPYYAPFIDQPTWDAGYENVVLMGVPWRCAKVEEEDE